MHLIQEAVERLLMLLEGTGCEDGEVRLHRVPDAPRCQFEWGVTIEARYGGRSGEAVSEHPIQALTRISFMKGAPLSNARQRTAALAITNAATSFLCISRRVHACPPECHAPCLASLSKELAGRRLFALGEIMIVKDFFGEQMAKSVEDAGIVLSSAEYLVSSESTDALAELAGSKRVMFLGPSCGGLCALLGMEQWCPYGR